MILVSPSSIPALRRGIRQRFDATREAHVLLGPERVIVLDDIAVAITGLVDAKTSIAEISAILAKKFETDYATVETDVIGFVQDLVDKGLVAA